MGRWLCLVPHSCPSLPSFCVCLLVALHHGFDHCEIGRAHGEVHVGKVLYLLRRGDVLTVWAVPVIP